MTEAECRKVLSANIRHYRKRLGLSQLTVALELDISPNFLSDIENEKKWVSPKTLTAIASVLNVNVYELFKPPAAEEPVSDSTYYTLKKCIEDATSIVKQSTRQSEEYLESAFCNLLKQYTKS
ncbi:MAG: hypothetical protein Ta2A_18610 [Treponemataceae bacterium]|nr:MAG: hypothetical protein Ta2A_18610 [Treponemataceae bacterium]